MRRLGHLVVLVAACVSVGAAAAADTPIERVLDKLNEALRLESQALTLFVDDPSSAEINELLATSAGLIKDAVAVPGANIDPGARADLVKAQKTDEQLVKHRHRLRREFAGFLLALAFHAKSEAIDIVTYSAWRADESKRTKPVAVSQPACRYAANTVPVAGCTGVDRWDIYVDKGARRAKCAFRGPAGELRGARPLFPGTLQRRTCKLAGFKTVDGVRKRVVHAELRITVPEGVEARSPRIDTVTAHWQ